MDDQNPITPDAAPGQPPAPSTEGEGVPVPSRVRATMDELKARVRDEAARGRDVVREYEERYSGSRRRLATPEIEGAPDPTAQPRLEAPERAPIKVKRAEPAVTANERKWAALAHGSTLLTALVALASGGLGVLLTMLVPLFIYFSFRKRSEFVAFHALQAFTIQLVGIVGWLALVVVGGIVWLALIIISALLILLAVGIVLLPVVVVLGILFFVGSLALPLAMVIYGVIAAVETWGGHNYRIPYIARWVENQMYSPDRPAA